MEAITATDTDLRDLLWRIGNSPGEIGAHMANPYTRAYLRVFIDEFNRRVAEVIARQIAEKLFSGSVEDLNCSQNEHANHLHVWRAGSCSAVW